MPLVHSQPQKRQNKSFMKKIIVVTGTPGTGKTVISEKIAKRVKNSELIRANDIVKELKLYTGRDRDGSLIVNMGRLKQAINSRIRKSRADVMIIEGHLLADIKIDGATAVVLREHLDPLNRRMKKRGYSKSKIEDNIVCEATDYCGTGASANYGRAYEFFSEEAEGRIMEIIKGKFPKKQESIELLDELNDYLSKK